jgi:glycosyltransferase involved in cell wall biosynthesis
VGLQGAGRGHRQEQVGRCVRRVYFDITDIIQFAGRNTRLTGIQRVVFNIVNLLSRKYGGEQVQCVYHDRSHKAMFAVDLSVRPHDVEFDAETLLVDLGLARAPSFFPSTVRVKSYLRNHARDKTQRALLKLRLYLWSFTARQRLRDLDLLPAGRVERGSAVALAPRRIEQLSPDSHLVHLGSSWFFPEVWRFSAEHRARGGDVVQFIHDLIPVTHPQFMPDKEPPVFVNWLQHAMGYAARFPCNSQWTAQSLQRYAQSQGKVLDIEVTTLAHEFIGYERDEAVALPKRLAVLAGKRFVLCVGTIESRKNGLSLLRAWQRLPAEMGEAAAVLVFAGRYGKIGGPEFREELGAGQGSAADVRVIDMPSDSELAWLYRNCLFTVYPSFVEGWGLPVGESAWFGKYCIASSASSIPEVCGSLVEYVDPEDTDGLKEQIVRLLRDDALLREREGRVAVAPLRRWCDVADDLYAYITAR